MAKLSLQEQLLKSGLVGAGHAKAVKSEKHKQVKQQQHNKALVVDDLKEQAQKVRLEQADRARQLNQQRKEEQDQKQLAAQIKQLIELNRLPLSGGLVEKLDDSIPYHFTENNKVKTLYLTGEMREKLGNGQLAIVKLGRQYEVVTSTIAEKIKARDASSVIVLNEPNLGSADQEDPYAEYQVPDDLTW
jgi:uncharacterized protein YaiL (DUF2058 family)